MVTIGGGSIHCTIGIARFDQGAAMRTAAIVVLGGIVGCGLLLAGCWPNPSDRELFEWTHHTYTVATDPGEPEVSGGTDDENQAEADLRQPARMAQSNGIEPAEVEAVFEAYFDTIDGFMRKNVLSSETTPGNGSAQ